MVANDYLLGFMGNLFFQLPFLFFLLTIDIRKAES